MKQQKWLVVMKVSDDCEPEELLESELRRILSRVFKDQSGLFVEEIILLRESQRD